MIRTTLAVITWILLIWIPGLDERLVIGEEAEDGRRPIYLYDENLQNPELVGWYKDGEGE